MLPLPSPISCAAALRLCSCSRAVAEEAPAAEEELNTDCSIAARASEAEAGRANDVDVVGGAGIPVGVAGFIVGIAFDGTLLGVEEGRLLTLPVDPNPPPYLCRGL